MLCLPPFQPCPPLSSASSTSLFFFKHYYTYPTSLQLHKSHTVSLQLLNVLHKHFALIKNMNGNKARPLFRCHGNEVSHHGSCSTLVTIGIKQGCGVREASAVGVVVHCPHPGLIAATVLPRNVDWISDAAVGQPARVTLVQAGLPGKVELSDGSQLSSQRVTVGGGRGQAQLLRHCGVKDLT